MTREEEETLRELLEKQETERRYHIALREQLTIVREDGRSRML